MSINLSAHLYVSFIKYSGAGKSDLRCFCVDNQRIKWLFRSLVSCYHEDKHDMVYVRPCYTDLLTAVHAASASVERFTINTTVQQLCGTIIEMTGMGRYWD